MKKIVWSLISFVCNLEIPGRVLRKSNVVKSASLIQLFMNLPIEAFCYPYFDNSLSGYTKAFGFSV